MNRVGIAELRSKLDESIKDLGTNLDNKDLEGSKRADMRTAAIRNELKKRRLELELELY